MAIKWEDYELGVTAITNKIIIGKSKPVKGRQDLREWIDKSGDKTEMAVKAVMEHMLNICKDRGSKDVVFSIDGMLTLTLENLQFKAKVEEME